MSRYFNEGFDAMGGEALEHAKRPPKYLRKVKTKSGKTRYVYKTGPRSKVIKDGYLEYEASIEDEPANSDDRKFLNWLKRRNEAAKARDKEISRTDKKHNRVGDSVASQVRQIDKGLAAWNKEAMRQQVETTALTIKDAKKKKKKKK